jgi:hypothetical protein
VLETGVDARKNAGKAAGEEAGHEVTAGGEAPVGSDQMFPPMQCHDALNDEVARNWQDRSIR